jgi:chorismate synthase
LSGNRFGTYFALTTFGESHGPAMGAVIEGCPAGVIWRQDLLAQFLERRRPGREALTSTRNESDRARVLSGVYEDKTLGTPIALMIENEDARSKDYSPEKMKMRQGHATDLWQEKYGHSDPRGSGRASGRETVSRVLGGAVARMFVEQLHREVRVIAFTESIGSVQMTASEVEAAVSALQAGPWDVDRNSLRCPSPEKNAEMEKILHAAKMSGESHGGAVQLRLIGVPRGLGAPVFGKLKSSLAAAMMSIGATTALEIGEGFVAVAKSGTEFHNSAQNYGGIRGGISTGDPISARVSFKPTSSIKSVALSGRHDPCIVPRAVPVVEAMAWLVLADLILSARLDRV